MNVKTRLLMVFKDSDDKRVSISVDSPKADLLEEEIHDAMALILDKDIFAPNGGKLEAMVEAKVVQTNTSEYDLIF